METATTEKKYPELLFENVEDGETIQQRCLIIKARFSPTANAPSMVTVEQDPLYPPQAWPVEDGNTKMVVMLSAGSNLLSIYPNSDATQPYNLKLDYRPNSRVPPLHLAVMIGRDSDLTIDTEPSKPRAGERGSIGSALARFRMAAYMWQAVVAEDMRQRGLGRRSFRLDEWWDVDTTSARFRHAADQDEIFEAGATRDTAKINPLRSEHTVGEIRDAAVARDNPLGRNSKKLHTWFLEALIQSGSGIFTWSARPIVAGLILDATWSQDEMFALGHAALGSHDATGVSLCTFGSHLMYSWPEHMEDLHGCLTDVSRPEEGVVSTGIEGTGTMWEACSVGQVEFLHQLGHAFGAGHTTGIMKGGCSSHWPRHFVPRTSPSTQTGEVGTVITSQSPNEAVFDIKDLLFFKHLPHFWMEGDEKIQGDPLWVREAQSSVSIAHSRDPHGDGTLKLLAASPASIVRVLWNGEAGATGPSLTNPVSGVSVPISEIEAAYSRDEPLRIAFLGGNGKERVLTNLWALLDDPAALPVPGSDLVLHRRSARCKDLEEGANNVDRSILWAWATLLSRPMAHGTIARASEVNVCIGGYLLGLYVRFQDGIRVNCGPRLECKADGRYEKHFGGVREDCVIPPSCEIVCVEVSRDADALRGVRLHLSNGDVKGALSVGSDYEQRCVLEPPSGEHIVGFFGRNYFGEEDDGMVEFGIITAPSDIELPAQVYDMPQLQNTDGGLTEADYDRDDDPYAIESDADSEISDTPIEPQAPFDVDNSDDELMAGTGLDLAAWQMDN